MRIEQIDIKGGDASDPEPTSTLAIADEMFAIHPTRYGAIEADEWEEGPCIAFTLTHRPTGYAVVTGRSWVEVLGYWSEIHARSSVNWNITDPDVVSRTIGPVFRSIRKAVEARVIAASALPPAVDAESKGREG